MFQTLFMRKAEFDIFDMTGADCRDMSALHGERFARGWGDGEFHSLLSQDSVFGFVARQTNHNGHSMGGFVLSREVAGDAEILTIAVNSRFGRAGLGWRLMQAAIRQARARGGESMFLEVDEGNAAALGLYRKLGFVKVGERKAYYQGESGQRAGALVMRLDLR
jgi:ribosomal-protein-alanine N-acetyltransferase